jgi:threonine aldolase
MIDLRSDTVTKPSKDMLQAMFNAEVGDDVLHDDPSVIALEKKITSMFGMEAALFCPSGTMANQIAIKTHTRPGDEVICDAGAHVYFFEGGGIAQNAGCSIRTIQGNRGRFSAEQVSENINNPHNEHLALTKLVVIENTCNKGGGSYWDFHELIKIGEVCKHNNLSYHLDGARLFNALTETKETPQQYGKLFDSISICLSKGLGAPVGSVLLGTEEFIRRAHRYRKSFGGGMRQAGYLAAAGTYALDNNISRLAEDHRRAKELASTLAVLPYVEKVLPVDTNIIVFQLNDKINADAFLLKLEESGILMIAFGPQIIRAVTHLDFSDDELKNTICKLQSI